MSKHDFSSEEFASRLARTRAAIADAGLDWLLTFHPVSIHWLTGSDAKSYQEFQCLFVSADDKPLTILTRQGEGNEFRDDSLVDEIILHGGGEPEDPIAAFERVTGVLPLRGQRVGMEVPAFYLHPHHYEKIKEYLGDSFAAEATNLIPDLKLVKSAQELEYIFEAARIADNTMEVFAASLQAGRSESELAGTICQSLLSQGSGIAASPINLVSGERSCFSHGAPTQRKLQIGDTGNVEFGATFHRYTSTIGRQFNIGKTAPRTQEIYEVVRRACDACIAEIKPGVLASAPHEAAKKVIADAGFESGRVHLSGYGLAPGFPPSWAEPLHLFGGSTHTLQAGMVMTVEPPIFLSEEKLGARIIDNVLVTDHGAKLLSKFSRDIIIVE
jgi:Xaa-Pro dipeptidase